MSQTFPPSFLKSERSRQLTCNACHRLLYDMAINQKMTCNPNDKGLELYKRDQLLPFWPQFLETSRTQTLCLAQQMCQYSYLFCQRCTKITTVIAITGIYENECTERCHSLLLETLKIILSSPVLVGVCHQLAQGAH